MKYPAHVEDFLNIDFECDTDDISTAYPFDCTQPHWSPLKPLPDGLPSVAPFPDHILPNAVREWILDVTASMGVPMELVAIPAIVAMGSLIGRQACIRPKKYDGTWAEYSNIWGCCIGRPSVMKSPAMKAALVPMKPLISSAQKVFEEEKAKYAVASKAFKLKQRAAEKKAADMIEAENDSAIHRVLSIEPPREPALRRYYTDDPTAAALTEILKNNPNGILVKRDELVTLFIALGREDNSEGRALFMSGWSGSDSFTADRIGRGHVHLEAVCLSVLGTAQPDAISAYVDRTLVQNAGDGFLQRFDLMVWPDIPGDFVHFDQPMNEKAFQRAEVTFKRLSMLDASAFKGERSPDGPMIFQFNEGAQRMFEDWLERWMRQVNSPNISAALESHLVKRKKTVLAYALIFHLAEGCLGPVDERAMHYAIELVDYLVPHAERVYRAGQRLDVTRAQTILSNIQQGALQDGFTVRDICRKGWSGLTQRENVLGALDVLAECHYVRKQMPDRSPKGGRKTERYLIHPQIQNEDHPKIN